MDEIFANIGNFAIYGKIAFFYCIIKKEAQFSDGVFAINGKYSPFFVLPLWISICIS
jgi:hypothetical protein